VVRGGFWVFALRIVDRLFRLARTIVLARLLAPKDFGLFGIALLAMSALETFSQTGFQQALIQTKRDIRPYLDTAWTVQAIRGAVLASILFGIAPYVAVFFGEPAAAALLRVLGLSMLFQGFANIGVIYFQKELEFHKQFVYQLSGTLVDVVVAITAALLLRNAWALIFGLLAGNFTRMVVSYPIHPYRPGLRLEGEKAKELYSFGRWVLGSSIVIFLLTQGDDALVGRVLGTTALGFYQMAYLISNLPATEITHVISQVTFPAYAKIQDRTEVLKTVYLRVLRTTTLVSLPLGVVIAVAARDLVDVFLGQKWLPMVPVLQVLSIFGILRSVNATLGPLYHGLGHPEVLTKVSAIQLLLLAGIIYPLTIRWGILGTSIAVTLSNGVCFILASREGIRLIRDGVSEFLKAMRPGFFGALGSGFLLMAIQWLTPAHWGGLSRLILEVVALAPISVFLILRFVRPLLSARKARV